jgi:hypothetical protein
MIATPEHTAQVAGDLEVARGEGPGNCRVAGTGAAQACLSLRACSLQKDRVHASQRHGMKSCCVQPGASHAAPTFVRRNIDQHRTLYKQPECYCETRSTNSLSDERIPMLLFFLFGKPIIATRGLMCCCSVLSNEVTCS